MLQNSVTHKQRLALINSMIQAGDVPQAKSFIEALARRIPQQKEELMTIAEQLKQMGREEGLSEGRYKGRNEGQREATLAIAQYAGQRTRFYPGAGSDRAVGGGSSADPPLRP